MKKKKYYYFYSDQAFNLISFVHVNVAKDVKTSIKTVSSCEIYPGKFSGKIN